MIDRVRESTYNALRWSESIFKTDMVYAAKGGFWLVFGQIISTLSSFLLAIAFANLMSKEAYGTYRYLLSLSGMLLSISLSGISPAITRSVAKGFEGIFIKGFMLSLRWSLIMTTLAALFSIYYYLHGNLVLSIGMLLIGAFAPFIDSAEVYNSFLNGKAAFKFSALTRSLRSLLTGASIFLTLFLTQNPLIILGVYFLSNALCVGLLFLITKKFFKPNNKISEDAFLISKHVSIINFLSTVADRIDNIFLFHYFGAAALAIYNFSLLMPNTVIGFLKNIGTLAIPKLVNKNAEEGKRIVGEKTILMLYVTIPLTTLYILLCPIVFKVFFPAYEDSIIYSQIFAIGILINASIPMALLDAHVAIKEKYKLSVISNVSKVVLLFFGILYFGIWGAIIARLLSKMIGFISAFRLSKKLS